MSRRAAVFLYVFAGWTVWVWAVLIRNMAADHTHSTGFKVVHVTLAVISIAFAAGTVLIVRRVRRQRRLGPPAESPERVPVP